MLYFKCVHWSYFRAFLWFARTGEKSHLLQYIFLLVSMRLQTACSQIFCLVLVMIWSHGTHRHAVEMRLAFNLCSSFLSPPSAEIPGVCLCPASVGFNEAWLGIVGGSPENISAWSCSNWSFHVWILTLKNKRARCNIFLENRFFPLNLLSIVFFLFSFLTDHKYCIRSYPRLPSQPRLLCFCECTFKSPKVRIRKCQVPVRKSDLGLGASRSHVPILLFLKVGVCCGMAQ